MSYVLGQRSVIPAQFNAVDGGALVDPAEVVVKVYDPQGLITTYVFGSDPEITRLSLGLYEFEILLTKPGKWRIRWEGRSSNETAGERIIVVSETPFYGPDGDELPDS